LRVCRHKKAKTDKLYSFSSYLYFSDLWWFLSKMEKWSDKPKIKLFSSDFLLFLYYFLNSAALFLVRYFYILKWHFRIYPLIWGFSGVLGSCIVMKSPTQTNGEVWKTTKMMFIQGRPQSSSFYLYIGSERSAFQCAPILLARWQNVG